MPEPELLHPEAGDALEILIIVAHVLGLFVNLLLGEKWFLGCSQWPRVNVINKF